MWTWTVTEIPFYSITVTEVFNVSGRVVLVLSYCSSVKKRLRCDVQSPVCLPSPIGPAASLRSQEPTPSARTPGGRGPTRIHSRSDSGPPRCSRQRRLHTACRTQADVSVGYKTVYTFLVFHQPSSHLPDQALGGYSRVAKTDFPLRGLTATKDSRALFFLSSSSKNIWSFSVDSLSSSSSELSNWCCSRTNNTPCAPTYTQKHTGVKPSI